MQKSYFNNVRQRSRSHLEVKVQKITFRVRSTSRKRLINSWNFVQIWSIIRRCAEKKNINSKKYFTELCPFENFTIEIVSTQLWNPLRYCHEPWYIYKASSKDVRRTRTITTTTYIFDKIMPLCKFHNGKSVCTITSRLRYFHKTWYKYKACSDHVQRTRTITPSTFLLNYSSCKFSVWKMSSLNNFKTLEIFHVTR